MSKQTAVDWLIEQRQKYGSIIGIDLEQAKAMEKQQIMNAWAKGVTSENNVTAEQYYNETFNK